MPFFVAWLEGSKMALASVLDAADSDVFNVASRLDNETTGASEEAETAMFVATRLCCTWGIEDGGTCKCEFLRKFWEVLIDKIARWGLVPFARLLIL